MNAPTRPVRRTYDMGERRPIVTTIHPSGVVEFREKGRRRVYTAHIRSLFTRAVQHAVEDEKKQRRVEREVRRAARS